MEMIFWCIFVPWKYGWFIKWEVISLVTPRFCSEQTHDPSAHIPLSSPRDRQQIFEQSQTSYQQKSYIIKVIYYKSCFDFYIIVFPLKK